MHLRNQSDQQECTRNIVRLHTREQSAEYTRPASCCYKHSLLSVRRCFTVVNKIRNYRPRSIESCFAVYFQALRPVFNRCRDESPITQCGGARMLSDSTARVTVCIYDGLIGTYVDRGLSVVKRNLGACLVRYVQRCRDC